MPVLPIDRFVGAILMLDQADSVARICRLYLTVIEQVDAILPSMNLREVGDLVRERREALGLSQERLARLAGLSRATINQLETGTLVDLGVAKLAALMDLVGLRLDAGARPSSHHGLLMASRTASVSYKQTIDAAQLAQALATGDVPANLVPHVSTFIDEAPLPLVVSAVEEAAQRGGVPPKRIWRHLLRWAREFHSPRQVWA
jgi:transcriptional regulator with XRE-family HTH domain